MSLFPWKEEYNTGITEVDNQHQELVSIINKLFDAMKQGKANDVLGAILLDLIKYIKIHFKTEEKYFELYNYKDAFAHKYEHDSFTEEIFEFKKGFESGKITLSINLFNYLKDWLIHHIQGEDRKFISCFKENGLG